MKRPSNSVTLFLCTFSGEDCSVIKASSKPISIIFAAIGLFVISIFIGCFISAYDFSYSLFQGNRIISIPIGLIWSLLVVNMYLLLLYTVSPAMLPIKNKKKQDSFFTLSMFFRIMFMSLLAIIISQPLNVLAFSESVQESLQKHIQQEKTRMVIVADSLLIKKEIALFHDFNQHIKIKLNNNEFRNVSQNLLGIKTKISADSIFVSHSINLLKKVQNLENKTWLTAKEKNSMAKMLSMLSILSQNQISSDEQFAANLHNISIDNGPFQIDFDKYKQNLKNAINAKIENNNNLDYLLSQSNFYIKRIQLILYEQPFSWLVTACIVLMFLLPIFFKYKVRDKTDFYPKKLAIEKRIIDDEYKAFKIRYSRLLQNNIKNYNLKSLTELKEELLKLKKASNIKFEHFRQQVEEEYKEEIISKYTYWADDPFRTERKFNPQNLGKEADFFKLIYPEET